MNETPAKNKNEIGSDIASLVDRAMKQLSGEPDSEQALEAAEETVEAVRALAREKESETICAIAGLLDAYLENLRQKRHLEQERRLANAIAQKQNLYHYVLKEGTYEILYLGDKLKETVPGLSTGSVCYQFFHHRKTPCPHCPLESESGSVTRYNKGLGCWISAEAAKIEIGNGEHGILVSIADLSSLRKHMFSIDELTGVSSTTRFVDDVTRALEKTRAEKYALVAIDLKGFRMVNQRAGFEKGNEVLRSFAEFLSANLEEDEYVCRYFADVFLLFLRYETADGLKCRLQMMRENMDHWAAEAFDETVLSIQCGVYLIPREEKNFSRIVERADLARKSALREGGMPEYAVYDQKMSDRIRKERETERRMADALANDEFIVYMQPKIDLRDNRIVGAEALIRWKRPTGKISLPGEFLPVFEKNGFIKKLDYYMCEHVFRLLHRWEEEGKTVLPVSINISTENMQKPAFAEKIKDLIEKYRIPPYTVEMELTERMLVERADELVKTINELRTLGIMFSIDDFGSGYSSLNLIRSLPIDVLKLDKDFFDHIHLSERERSMLMHVIRLAKSLDMSVLCEGVETEEQLEYLKSVDCDMAQGFLFARPMPTEQFQKMLKAQSAS